MVKLYLTFGKEEAPEGYDKIDFPGFSLNSISDNSVDEILAHHVLDKESCIEFFISEVARVLKSGCSMNCENIYYRCPMAWGNPNVLRGISEASFCWVSKSWREANLWNAPDTDIDMDVQFALSINQDFDTRSEDAKAFAMQHYANGIPAIKHIFTKK